jgi:PPOX class probable F420-dependent enzyme
VTFRRSGDPVATPVWFAIEGGRLYFKSERRSGKVRRLRRDPRVLVAPCTVRGRALGPAVEGAGRVLDEGEAAAAERALRGQYGAGRRLYERFVAGGDSVWVEVVP